MIHIKTHIPIMKMNLQGQFHLSGNGPLVHSPIEGAALRWHLSLRQEVRWLKLLHPREEVTSTGAPPPTEEVKLPRAHFPRMFILKEEG